MLNISNYLSYSPYSFANCTNIPLITVGLSDIYNYIKDGLSSKHIYQIGQIRGASSIDCHNKQINILKAQLPFVYITGIRAFHSKDYELDYNGNLHVDLDFKSDISVLGLELLKEKLSNDPYIKLMFISPSGRGLKLIVPTLDYNTENYYSNLQKFGEYLSCQYSIETKYIDPITYKHVSFISYDPNCFFNKNVSNFPTQTNSHSQREISLSDEEKVKVVKLFDRFNSPKLVFGDIF